MEMHWVHWNTAYGNVSEAIKYRDGLAVIGILFNATDLTGNNLGREVKV